MTLKRLLLILLISAVPLATFILVAVYHVSPSYQDVHFSRTFPPLLSAFASLSALYALCLLILVFYITATGKSLKDKIQSLEKNHEEAINQNKYLQRQVDLLSAIREASLVLTQDVDFQTIIKKVLDIAYQLACPICSLHDELTLFLKDEVSGKLTPLAQKKGAQVIFEEELDAQTIDRRNVDEALEYSRVFFASDGEMYNWVFPLIADREIIGVLKVKTLAPPSADKNNIEQRIKELQEYLTSFSNILALAVKTPMLYNKAITDGLTHLFTKRHLMNELPFYFEIASRYNEPLSLVMFDIDHFKNVNDTYGHPTGDAVLKEMADMLMENLRKASSAYRYGGEEIVIILPHSNRDEALIFAERLRKKIENHLFATATPGESIRSTISLGITEYNKSMKDFKELITNADIALYQAKLNGRNQSVVI